MSEKYYVVSESELNKLQREAESNGMSFWPPNAKSLEKAATACRARPVPEWATHFAGAVDWDNFELDQFTDEALRIERVKR